MDESSPSPHVHDWLSSQSFKPRSFDQNPFDPRQILDGMTAGFGPMKALTVQQLEMMTLLSRRAQAYLGIPQRLSRCRTQSDVFNEQMRFWQTAMSQYQEAATRISSGWSEAFASLAETRKTAAETGIVVMKPVARNDFKPIRERTTDLIRVPRRERVSG